MVVWHIDLLVCMHTHPQGYTEIYKHRSIVKDVGGLCMGTGLKERLFIKGEHRLNAWKALS